MKIFSTFDLKTVKNCQFFSGFLPVEHIITQRRVNFINSLRCNPNLLLRLIFEFTVTKELNSIASKYSMNAKRLATNPRRAMHDYFASECAEL